VSLSLATPVVKMVATIVLAASTVAALHRRTDDGSERRPAVELVESSSCRRSEFAETTTRRVASPRVADATVTVRIQPTVFVRLDTTDHVVAAATNTGCRPRSGDDVYLFGADGVIRAGSWSDISDCRWQGDFTVAARYQPQQCPRRGR
jgi:hypothetical protein